MEEAADQHQIALPKRARPPREPPTESEMRRGVAARLAVAETPPTEPPSEIITDEVVVPSAVAETPLTEPPTESQTDEVLVPIAVAETPPTEPPTESHTDEVEVPIAVAETHTTEPPTEVFTDDIIFSDNWKYYAKQAMAKAVQHLFPGRTMAQVEVTHELIAIDCEGNQLPTVRDVKEHHFPIAFRLARRDVETMS